MERPQFSLTWFLFSFEGRIGRLAYWAYTVAVLIVIVAIAIALGGIAELAASQVKVPKGPAEDMSLGVVLTLVAVVLLYCWTNYAVHAKRWHDRGKSGWWSLIGFVPYIGGIWILVECGFLKGTEGPNAYGHDPRGGNLAEVFD